MKKTLIGIVVLLVVGCSSSSQASYTTITSEEAYTMMQELNDEVVLDVRTIDEFVSGHIENAQSIPLDNIQDIEVLVPQKETPLLIYCRSGNRSAQASEQLSKLGYTQVYDFGGIQDWNYAVVK